MMDSFLPYADWTCQHWHRSCCTYLPQATPCCTNHVVSMVYAITNHHGVIQKVNPENLQFYKMLVWKPVTLNYEASRFTDVYLNKSLRDFKRDIITTATTVAATQLPLIRNPLAHVRIKRGGRRTGDCGCRNNNNFLKKH